MTNAYDVAHFLAGMMLVCSFTLLYQDRIFAVLNTFAAQAMMLSLAVAWQGYVQQSPDLFITAAMAFGLKGIVIPVALNRMIIRLGIHRDVDQVVNAGVGDVSRAWAHEPRAAARPQGDAWRGILYARRACTRPCDYPSRLPHDDNHGATP